MTVFRTDMCSVSNDFDLLGMSPKAKNSVCLRCFGAIFS